ncbi:MAG: HAMP domain-containing histidine kinase [Proteobacteria bacterium]|nr:HAMP domain-containing histidine kinase [Pseudomonadota bacterium]
MKDGSALQQWKSDQYALNKLYVHDFKNPLSVVMANLSYFEAILDPADEDARAALDDSMMALHQLLHMYENFLRISQMEAGDMPPRSAVSVAQLVQAALERLQRVNAWPDAEILLCGDVPDATCEWPIDCVRVALDNMLFTALQHARSPKKVHFSVAIDDAARHVVFACEDNGIPIAAAHCDVSFERTFQPQAKHLAHARYGRAMAMYAIGLAAQACGGTARAETSARQWPRIALVLPLSLPSSP